MHKSILSIFIKIKFDLNLELWENIMNVQIVAIMNFTSEFITARIADWCIVKSVTMITTALVQIVEVIAGEKRDT
jgi:hypothetical protein